MATTATLFGGGPKPGTAMRSALFIALATLTMGLSGCFGFTSGAGELDFEPGTDFKVTGKTVHLKAAVADLLQHEVYPGFHANLWAFCMKAADPKDQYSVDAVEYFNVVETDGKINGTGGFGPGQCSVPAPTIRVQQGDLVKVDFTNDHFHSHTIHWHGQYVPWLHDGVPGVTQDSVDPQSSKNTFNYEFIASRAGTLWYHCHVDTHFHVMQGLYGMFIVEPQNDEYEPEDIDKEYYFVYSTLNRGLVQVTPVTAADPHALHRHKPGECGASGVQLCQNPSVDTKPDTWLINGRSAPNSMQDLVDTIMVVNEGERVRVRMLNAGETFETIHTHGHDMFVTHRDGNPIPPAARFYVDTLTIGPAERYDVVIDMKNEGLWVMHSHVDHHVANDGQNPGGNIAMIVYQNILDERGGMKTFASESWGGLPYIVPLEIPLDVQYGRDMSHGLSATATPTAVDKTWTFPWDMPCATRLVRVTAEFDPNQAGLPGQSLTAVITGPDGDEVASFDIEEGSIGEWLLDGRFNPLDGQDTKDATAAARIKMVEDLISGGYDVRVTGTAPPGTLRFHVELDYHTAEAGLEEEKTFLVDASGESPKGIDFSKGEGTCDSDPKTSPRIYDPTTNTYGP